jgi:TPR repeat protein
MSASTRGSKRRAAEDADEASSGKQAKLLNPEAVAKMREAIKDSRAFLEWLQGEMRCPIFYTLFLDPVEAEDGKIYERAAIEAHFAKHENDANCKSPLTNEPMGKRLTPATWVKNAVAKLVEKGLADEEDAKVYKQARLDQAQVAALRMKAEAGNAHAMGRLGFSYRDGTRGLKKDPKEAFKWFKKAADLKDPPAATSCGVAYINGSGVERNHTRGIMMVTIAATLGSEHACSVLAWANECGHHGFDKNPEEATRWYKEMLKAPCRDSVTPYRERATNWLREHP